MELYEREHDRQRAEAARRVAERTPERRERETALASPGGLAVADSPERIARRVDRLGRLAGDGGVLEPDPRLQRIIDTVDYLGVRYLDAGVAASRAVARIDIRDGDGRTVGYGTGALVSPVLLLTNHHVLPNAATARTSAAEFDYQDGVDGRPLPSVVHPLDPDRFFLADAGLDFALVAVGAPPADLAEFGFDPLIEAEGKEIVGEFVTIVQHPRGGRKQVALRENRIVDVPGGFLHYAADTEPGSSGSPVFNDQWEVVALHHASVPAPRQDELGGFVNEGIRISRICRAVREADLTGEQRGLAEAIFAPARPEGTALRDAPAVALDPDYAGRGGYDPAFLARPLPLPVPSAELAAVASAELRYHHFSVVMHRRRRLALFTAGNIDGALAKRPKRQSDRWIFDPRLPVGEQTGESVYRDNDLDRGHLVRRLDPAWGTTAVEAKAAEDDTFHFTNSTPQHHAFNAGQTLWLGLEDYVLGNADNHDLAVTVFTGPVLADDDDAYRGVQLPREFWKVVAMARESGELSVTGYLLSQAALIEDLPTEESFSYGAYRTFQVPVRRIADITGLGFDQHIQADPLERLEATPAPRELTRPEDIVL
ncbi:DNA/RNA non-specific endonuclease [Actinomadura graeca]|uniref:DNA/RNA non-specific endonuclease n=1 Tax=Actinomadura graeca TaxID=2750812 RepID=A0ABX8QND1_9ACTN|nr:DNA/RNA non-specific endonuclease [Actinomadura graeca]QXJ20286.1 DNA/RNA non-specific endonuclease [Actinomadura graeca]